MKDWNLFWSATTAAATVATAISTGVVLWLQRRNRPEACWEISTVRGSGRLADPPSSADSFVDVEIKNIGDAPAYGVLLSGEHCRVVEPIHLPDRPQKRLASTVVGAGGCVRVRAVPVDAETALGDMTIRVHWTPPPTRLGKIVIDVLPLVDAVSAAGIGRDALRRRELAWWQVFKRVAEWRQKGRRLRSLRRVRDSLEVEPITGPPC